MTNYGELYQLRKGVKTIIENNDGLKSTSETGLDQLANPSLSSKIFVIVGALAGGTSAAISSVGGGGGNSDTDLHWDSRRPDEEEEGHRRKCLMFAIGIVKQQYGKKSYRR